MAAATAALGACPTDSGTSFDLNGPVADSRHDAGRRSGKGSQLYTSSDAWSDKTGRDVEMSER